MASIQANPQGSSPLEGVSRAEASLKTWNRCGVDGPGMENRDFAWEEAILKATIIDKDDKYQRNAVRCNRGFFNPSRIFMPAEFNSFGIRFLYPENWTLLERDEEESDQGATLDLPGGGFFALEMTHSGDVQAVTDRVVDAIANDYDAIERENLTLDVLPEGTPVTDLRFYYLDLLIVSRVVVLSLKSAIDEEALLVLQLQAESRDFDKNEAVFAAILKQIVDAD